ncbi:MAG: CNNM domain-containing protein, partial [Pseudomonadota bacterium]
MIEILATFETIIASEWTLLLAILLLLSLSGLLSCSETSFTGSSQAKLHQYAREGDNRAQRVIGLIMNRQRLIGAILIGNNLVNIMASALASVWFFKIFGDVGVFYATMIMTMLIVIFAEVIPKNIALIKPEGVAMRMARPMKWTVKLFSPLVYLIDKLILPFIVNEKEKNQISSQEHEIELRGAIELHHNEEPETEEERKMLRSILDLDDTTVDSAMTHRTNVEMIDLDSDYDENIIRILENSYTRVPLYRSDHDRIVGVLHARNLLRAIGLTQSQNDKSKK